MSIATRWKRISVVADDHHGQHRVEPMRDDDELKPGVDKPTRWQYAIGALVIIVASLAAYWWLGHH